MVCSSGGSAYEIVFGNPPVGSSYYPMSINHLKDGKRHQLEYKKISPVRAGKPFTCKVKLGVTTIHAYYGRSIALKTKKPRQSTGRVSLDECEFSEIILEGKIEPAWLQGLVDQRMAAELTEFEKSYNRTQFIPAWLLSGPIKTAKSDNDRRIYPGEVSGEFIGYLNASMDLLNKGKYVELTKRLAKATDEDAPPQARSLLMSLALLRLGKAGLHERRPDPLPHGARVYTQPFDLQRAGAGNRQVRHPRSQFGVAQGTVAPIGEGQEKGVYRILEFGGDGRRREGVSHVVRHVRCVVRLPKRVMKRPGTQLG